MIIIYKPGLKTPSVHCNTRISGITFTPGENKLTDTQYDLIKLNRGYRYERSLGIFEEVKEEPKPVKKEVKKELKEESKKAETKKPKEEKKPKFNFEIKTKKSEVVEDDK